MTDFFKHIPVSIKQRNFFTIAYQMLIHSRKKFIGMLIGATFSAFIIMQQPGIYRGICDRLVADILSTQAHDLWVMGPNSRDFNNPTFFTAMDTYRVRSIPGVASVEHLYRVLYSMILDNSRRITWVLIGVDPKSWTGLPEKFLAGSRMSIQNSNSMIIDGYALRQLRTEDNKTIRLGDGLIEGQHRWQVTGITKPLRTWELLPKAYMLSSHIPDIVHRPSFMLVNVKSTANLPEVALKIHKKTGYDVLTRDEFVQRALTHFKKSTPIIIIFICIAILGFVIGLIIMWQIFSNFILTHLHQFGMLKMLGISNAYLTMMVMFQAFITGGIGYIIGLCLAILFGVMFHDTNVAFHLTWQIVLLGALGTLIIIVLASCFSIMKVLRLDTVDLCRDTN